MTVEDGTPRSRPLVLLVSLGWVAVYLLLMADGGWAWQGAGVLGFGAPAASSLQRFGAPVPALVEDGQWQRIVLSSWLHRSLLGLLLLLWFYASVGRNLASLVGLARAWLIFLAGGVAGACAHVLTYAGSQAVGGAGPFDAILGGLGALLLWGLVNRGDTARTVVRSTVVSLLVLAALTWYFTRDAPDTYKVREIISRESAIGGFGGGLLAMLLLGPRRAAPSAGLATKVLAWAGSGLLLLAAAVQAHGTLGSSDPEATARFLEQLEQTEYEAWEISRDPTRTTHGERAGLAGRLDAVLRHDLIDDLAPEAAAALRAYVETLRVYTTGNVPRPWETEAACRKAFAAWYEEHEKPLRESAGLPERIRERRYWEPL